VSDARGWIARQYAKLTYDVGAHLWGWALLVWVVLVLIALGFAFGAPNCKLERADPYCVVSANNQAVAGITAVLGLAWSWFLQMSLKKRELDLRRAEFEASRRREASGRRKP